MLNTPVPPEFARALRELGLSDASSLKGMPLTGGVSSDIWCIETDQGLVCAKRALAKLRVAADWQAPVERNLYEARWLQVANTASPACAPALLGQHAELGVLVMRYLPPTDYRLWKEELHAGRAEAATAQAGAKYSRAFTATPHNKTVWQPNFPHSKFFLKSAWRPT
jgi:5-methylthioribose kinase